MNATRQDAGVRRKVGAGVAQAAIGSLLVSFEFFAGPYHGFTSVPGAGNLGKNIITLFVYAMGFLLIFSAIKNCPFTQKRE
jgi:hypothetical protein